MRSLLTWNALAHLARANAAGYAVMLLAFGLLLLLGVDGWLSFWLCRLPSWAVTALALCVRR